MSKIAKKAIFEIQILPKLISRKIGWQLDFHTVTLNFTFFKFLEHSVLKFFLFILQKALQFSNLFQVKVPHVCQLAHKLAYLVGESIHQRPKAMEELLYYL